MKLFQKAAGKNIPVLGICRGSQIINVSYGGSLYQDINVQKDGTSGHMPNYNGAAYPHHKVQIKKDTLLYDILQTEEIPVNSYHHQAVKNVAEGFNVAAVSKDGTIEAIESVNHSFIIGVQWHPEILFERYPVFLKIFKALVKASSK